MLIGAALHEDAFGKKRKRQKAMAPTCFVSESFESVCTKNSPGIELIPEIFSLEMVILVF